ncbi:MAG: Hsp70 family protein [Ardenticatenales bacterium]|nr:Hsp70 family protein [Ardenticatenales bacterium]
MKLGIDMGTHLARAAYLDDRSRPRLIPLSTSTDTFPCLARQTMHGLQVGPAAALTQVGNAETTISGCIRLMGRAGTLSPALLARLPYPVREEGGEAVCNLLYNEVRASEVYGLVVRALVEEAEQALGEPIEEVVLTVPASAEDRFRIQARASVEAQGIKVSRLINQPAAALLAAALPATARCVAVVNCGGGSTDVSIAERGDAGTRILATAGDMLLGADDLGWNVAERLNERFQVSSGVNVFAADGSGVAMQGLRTAAWEALSTLAVAPETLLVLDHGGGFGRDLVTLVRRSEVEGWLEPLLARIGALCQQALSRSQRTAQEIDAVVLIGEAAFLPPVQATIARAFGRSPSALHTAEAERLAVYGAALATADESALVWDVTPYPLGINCYYGNEELFSPILSANTPIPTPVLGATGAFTESYTTRYPGQTEVRLDILQYRGPRVPVTHGEGRVYPHECEALGTWHFTNLKPKKKKHAAFTVTFAVDADGILHLEAVETATGHRLVAHVDRGIG